MRYVSGKKKRRKGLVYRLRLLNEEVNYLGKKVVIRRLRALLSKIIFLSIFFFLVVIVTGAVGCGGPPQNTDVGEEGPAVLRVTAGGDIGEVVTTIISQHTVTINNGSASVPASQISLTSSPIAPISFAGGNYPGTGGTCSDTLAPFANCTVILEANAVTTGNINTSFSLSYWDGLAIQSFTGTITGTARDPIPAILTFSPTGNHDYGINAIGGIFDTTFTVTNSGELSATGITPGGLVAPFSIIGGTCGISLVMNQSCTFIVRYTPAAQVVSNDTLELNYNDGAAPQIISKNLQGEGRIAANLIVDQGTTFNFGMVNNSFVVDQPLTIRNTGGGTASAIAFNSFAAPYTLVANSCGTTLVPTATCTLTLRFAPTATTNYPLTPTINYSDGFNAQAINMNLSGDGFANTLTLNLIAPASSPSSVSTPTIRVSNTINAINIRLYRNAGCITQEGTTTPATAATLDFSPIMPEGTYQFHARAEDDYGNLSACSASLVNYEYDNTPPNRPSNVNLASILTTSSATSPNFTWTASPSPDVVGYEIGLSANAAGGNDIAGWTNVGVVTSASHSSLSLNECSSYFASVRSIDDVGLPSTTHATSPTSFVYDTVIPTPPSTLIVGADATPTNSATIDWTASSDTCGINRYEYAIGTTPGASNTLAWTNIGVVTSFRQNGMALASSTNYYTSIRAIDNNARVSTVATSAAWIIFDPPAALPNMIVWLDGADRSTIFDSAGRDATDVLFNGTVEDWDDKSGSANVHNFNSNLTAPTYSQADFSLQFGATTGMTTANHNEINLQTTDQRNITVAFRTSGDINTRQVLYEEGGNIRGMNVYIFNGRLYCGFYNTPNDGDGAQPFASINTVIATNQTYFVTWVFDYTNYAGAGGPDGNLNCYLNSALIGTTPTTSRLFGHSGAVGLGVINNQTMIETGAVVGSGANFLGEIYEVMLFNDAPDLADVSNVHTYLNNKW